jgi:hypothetical protein
MTKEDFVQLMKKKAEEINLKNDNKIAGKIGTIKQSSQPLSKNNKNYREEDELEEENDDDAGDLQINEEFKDVIRGVLI